MHWGRVGVVCVWWCTGGGGGGGGGGGDWRGVGRKRCTRGLWNESLRGRMSGALYTCGCGE